MKKYLKLATVTLAACVLMSGATGAAISTNNQAILNDFSTNQQADSVQVVRSLSDIKFTGNTASFGSMFGVVKGKTTEDPDRLYDWGHNKRGQLGLGSATENSRTVPTLVNSLPANAKIMHILSLANATLLILQDNSIWAAGLNNHGQFGNGILSGDAEYSVNFVKTSDFFVGKNITSVASGQGFSLVVADNLLYGWGLNANGQVGTGNTLDVKSPTLISVLNVGSKTLAEVKCGNTFATLRVTDGSKNQLYCWGFGGHGQLGFNNTTDYQEPKLLENPVIDSFTNYFVGLQSLFVYDKPSGKLYACGYNAQNQLGIPNTLDKTSLTEVPLRFSEKIANIVSSQYSTTIVTNTSTLYATGSGSEGIADNGLGTSETEFYEIIGVNPKSIFGSGRSTFAVTNEGLYAWGTADGTYGDGSIVSDPMPKVVDTFSTPSTLIQIKYNNAKTAQDVAKEIYSDTKVFNETVFKTYIDTTKFPAGTKFSMATAPVVDKSTGTIQCSINADKSYSLPDGAKSLTTAPFATTLTGFKILLESAITNKVLPSDTIYNLNNIVKAMKSGNTTDVNETTLNALFTVANFPTDNKFTLTNEKLENNIYKATLIASKANKNYLEVLNEPFEISITGLKAQPDSNVIAKVDAKDCFNANNIVKAINPTGSGAVNLTNLNLIGELINFPAGNTFTISNDRVIGGEYNGTLLTTKHYFEGDVVTADKNFSIKVTGLSEVPDSTVTPNGDAKNYFNANNIAKAINPTGSGAVDLNNLKLISNIGNFPTDNVFTISKDTVTNLTYNATLSASKYYLGGNVTTGPKTYSIQVTGLTAVPDSTVTSRADAKDRFNANNIVKAINPLSDGKINIVNLKSIANIGNFPADNIFTISNDTVASGSYNATLSASKYYLGGNVTIGPKTYPIQVTGLTTVPDSTVTPKTDAKDHFNANNIVKAINPKGDGVVNLTNLDLITNINSFPSDTGFTVSKDTSINGTYTATLSATKYYLGGNVTIGPKTFSISVTGLIDVPDSSVTSKAAAKDLFNGNNIVKAINPTGNGTVDMNSLALICNLINFPTGNIFTVSKDEVKGNVYFATFSATKYYFEGNFTDGDKTFSIEITGLQSRPNSKVILKRPTQVELDEIVEQLIPNESIENIILGKLIDLSYFPDGTHFTINTVTRNDADTTIDFAFTPDKVFKDGHVEANNEIYNADFKFVYPVDQPENNLGLIIGLSVGGVLLLLVITGLVIWYMKRRGGGYSPSYHSSSRPRRSHR